MISLFTNSLLRDSIRFDGHRKMTTICNRITFHVITLLASVDGEISAPWNIYEMMMMMMVIPLYLF